VRGTTGTHKTDGECQTPLLRSSQINQLADGSRRRILREHPRHQPFPLRLDFGLYHFRWCRGRSIGYCRGGFGRVHRLFPYGRLGGLLFDLFPDFLGGFGLIIFDFCACPESRPTWGLSVFRTAGEGEGQEEVGVRGG